MASGPQHRYRNQTGQELIPGTPEYEAYDMTQTAIGTRHNTVTPNNIDNFAHERNAGETNEYGVGVDECEYTAWVTATGDSIVSSNPSLVFGVLVTVATAGGAIEIRDGTTAGGTLVLTIPASAAAGTFYELKGAKFDNGIFIDDASTSGSLTVLHRDQ